MVATSIASIKEPEASQQGPPPVDLNHLSRYTLGNRSLEQEVLQLFVAQVPVTLDRLRRADSIKSWREAAHTIKGSARAVGAWQVASLAEQAEALETERGRDAAIARLQAALEEASRYIEELRASQA